MNIGIAAYPLSRKRKGLSHYVCLFNLIKELEMIDAQNHYFLYVPMYIKLPFIDNPRWHIRICKGVISKSSTLWQLFLAKQYLIKDKIDIFWTIENFFVVNLPKTIKALLTVHDIRSISYINWKKIDYVILERLFLKRSVIKADYIMTDSFVTRNKIKDLLYKSIESKSTVVYNSASDIFEPHDKRESAMHISKKYNTPSDYILAVITNNSIKNLDKLIKAFAYFKRDGAKEHLFIVGDYILKQTKLAKLCNKFNVSIQDIKVLGYVSEEDLVCLYCGARAFVCISLEEGFGLPLVEAMKCGTAVVCSNIDTFREIADDCVLYVDPCNIESISEGLKNVITNEDLNKELIQKGLNRASLFSWSESAEKVLTIFNNIYSEMGR